MKIPGSKCQDIGHKNLQTRLTKDRKRGQDKDFHFQLLRNSVCNLPESNTKFILVIFLPLISIYIQYFILKFIHFMVVFL